MSNEITDRDKYLAMFSESQRKESLKYAHEIRKFEIDLYWRRAAYFWTFIVAAFAAFFLLERGA